MKTLLLIILCLGLIACGDGKPSYRIVTDGATYRLEKLLCADCDEYARVGDFTTYADARGRMLQSMEEDADREARYTVAEKDKKNWHEAKPSDHPCPSTPTPTPIRFQSYGGTIKLYPNNNIIYLATPTPTP